MEDKRGYLGDANSEWQLKHFYKPLQRNQSKPLEIRPFIGLQHVWTEKMGSVYVPLLFLKMLNLLTIYFKPALF